MNKIVKRIIKFTQKAANLDIFQKTLIMSKLREQKLPEFLNKIQLCSLKRMSILCSLVASPARPSLAAADSSATAELL